jgi:hypothetical protein
MMHLKIGHKYFFQHTTQTYALPFDITVYIGDKILLHKREIKEYYYFNIRAPYLWYSAWEIAVGKDVMFVWLTYVVFFN